MSFRYFSLDEFACPLTGDNQIEIELVEKLDRARYEAGVPFTITSGYRSEAHNSAVGGSPNSAHMLGLAADIACDDSLTRFAMLRAIFNEGFARVGIYDDFIHVDIARDRINEVAWLND